MNFDFSGLDFSALGGAGAGALQEALLKALSAGGAVTPGSQVAGDGSPIKIEDLSRTLANLSHTEEDLKFWRSIPKEKAENTYTQYNRLRSYGSGGVSGFMAETSRPSGTDTTYERRAEQVKFLGTTRGVSTVQTVVNTILGMGRDPQIAQESINGTRWILEKAEQAMYFGDSSLSTLQFDGYKAKMLAETDSSLIVDMRGQALYREKINEAASLVARRPFFGKPTHLHGGIGVVEGVAASFYPKERVMMAPDANGILGTSVKGILTNQGPVQFVSNPFIDDQQQAVPAAAAGDADERPGVPTVSTNTAAGSHATSQFIATDAGTYRYQVVAFNDHGHSAAVALNNVAVVAGDRVSFALTKNGSGADTKWIGIYRSPANGAAGSERLIMRVPIGSGAVTFYDVNAWLPGCTTAFMFEQRPEAMALRQLAPLLRIPLGLSGPVYEFMLLLFICVVLKAPNKHVMFTNVADPVL